MMVYHKFRRCVINIDGSLTCMSMVILPLIAYRYHRTCLELLSHRHSCPLQLPVAISVHRSDCQTKNSNDNNNKNDESKS